MLSCAAVRVAAKSILWQNLGSEAWRRFLRGAQILVVMGLDFTTVDRYIDMHPTHPFSSGSSFLAYWAL